MNRLLVLLMFGILVAPEAIGSPKYQLVFAFECLKREKTLEIASSWRDLVISVHNRRFHFTQKRALDAIETHRTELGTALVKNCNPIRREISVRSLKDKEFAFGTSGFRFSVFSRSVGIARFILMVEKLEEPKGPKLKLVGERQA